MKISRSLAEGKTCFELEAMSGTNYKHGDKYFSYMEDSSGACIEIPMHMLCDIYFIIEYRAKQAGTTLDKHFAEIQQQEEKSGKQKKRI